MASLNSIIDNAIAYLSTRVEQGVGAELPAELKATVADLVESPAKVIKPILEALFVRYQIDPTIASKLISSLAHGITKERAEKYSAKDVSVTNFSIPFSSLQKELAIARLRDDVKEVQSLDDEKLVEILNNAALPFAKLLGSNVAQALAFADPAGVLAARPSISKLLRGGTTIDPIAVGNLFTRLADGQKQILVKLLSHQVTQAKAKYTEHTNELLRSGKHRQYLVDILRENLVPERFVIALANLVEANYTVADVIEMSDKQLSNMITKGLRSITD